jgi:hypothetical protein
MITDSGKSHLQLTIEEDMGMVSRFRVPLLALAMASYLSFFFTSPAMAGMIGSTPSPELQSSGARGGDIEKIQAALENEVVQAKLRAYGLTSEEIQNKLQEMTENQISLLAQASDDVLAGGDGIGFVIGILVIVLLVILIIKLMDRSIVFK